MEFAKLKEARERLNALRDELAKVFNEAGPEYDPAKVTSVELRDGTAFYEHVAAKNAEIEDAKKEVNRLEELRRGAENALEREEPGHVEGEGAPAARQRKSIGQLFTESVAYTGRPGGRGDGPTAHLDIDIRNALFEREEGWEPESTRTGIVTLMPLRPAPHVVDFINVIPTGQAAVKYMEEIVANNTAAERSEGQQFPEAALKLVERTVTVEKVPVWLPITDEQLEDEPQARAYVESRLVYFLRARVDLQVLRGNGSTPNLLGTENVTGIQTQAKSTDDLIDALYKLFVKIRNDHDEGGGDAEPNVVFIRASKWQDVVLMRTEDGVYIWGHPSQGGPQTAWGVPVALTNAVTSTKAITGDYQNHAFLAPRRGVDVQVTNSHNDFFTSGKQAVRADVRLAVVHLRPAAFGELTGL